MLRSISSNQGGITINGNALRYYKSAQALYLPVKLVDGLDGFELILNQYHYAFCGAEPPINLATSVNICQHKFVANRFLENAGIPVPKAYLLKKNEFKDNSYLQKLSHLKFPLVVKPLNEGKGKGVLCNINTLEELRNALSNAFSTYNLMIVEEFHANLSSYRVLVFNQKILGVILRHPAHVIGDGSHTIEELTHLTNKKRRHINEFLGPILLDTEAYICLREQGLSDDYIPKVGEKVLLAYTSNATRGGTYETVGKNICKENRKLMLKVAKVLNLKLVGIDVECQDINTPITHETGVIIEANEAPSVRIHEIPMYGSPTLVTRKIMRYFIYRHPLSYLYSLYFNKHTSFYVRCFMVALVIAIIYPLLASKGII